MDRKRFTPYELWVVQSGRDYSPPETIYVSKEMANAALTRIEAEIAPHVSASYKATYKVMTLSDYIYQVKSVAQIEIQYPEDDSW